jgi:hypothetical protein
MPWSVPTRLRCPAWSSRCPATLAGLLAIIIYAGEVKDRNADVFDDKSFPIFENMAAAARALIWGAVMSEVVRFPGVEAPPQGYSKNHVDTAHWEAFRDMEGEICDLDRMGEITRDLITQCAAREDSLHELELATFAVWQLAKMLKEFKANYRKRWHGELVGVS